MYVWPVLLVWDTALDNEFLRTLENCWDETLGRIGHRHGVTIQLKTVQLTVNAPTSVVDQGSASNGLGFATGVRLDPILNVASREFGEYADAVRSLVPWFTSGTAVAPSIIKFSSRAIDRPDAYAGFLDELSKQIRRLMCFEYQSNQSAGREDQWLPNKIRKKHGLRDVVKQNWSLDRRQDLTKIPDFLNGVVNDISSVLMNQNLGPTSSIRVRPAQTIVRSPAGNQVTQTTPPTGNVPDQVFVPSQPTKAWSPGSQKQADSVTDERPTREFRPAQNTPPPPTPVSTSSVEPTPEQAMSVEPVGQSEVRAEDTTGASVSAASPVDPENPQVMRGNRQPDGPTTTKTESVDMKKYRFWPWGKNEPKPPEPEQKSGPSGIPSPEDPKIGGSVPKAQGTDQQAETPRAKNGQLIVDTPSTINGKPWYTPKWFKIPVVGPSRDVELEYGGVNSLRLMAASVRGTRHQFYGEPNQDAFAIGKNDKFLVVVVCDGVGSAAHSAYGSKFISYSVARSLANSLESVSLADMSALRECITSAVQKASDGVQTWNDGALFAPDIPANEVDRRDLAATLVVGVVEIEPSSPIGRLVVVANVGDSPCYTFVDREWTLRTSATKDGEVLEHSTHALPTEVGAPVVLEWHDFVMNPREQLLLMTDGIGTSLASGRTPLGNWLGEQLSSPSLAQDFLSTVDAITFDRQGEDDDRTLVVLYDFDHAFTMPEPPATEEAAVIDSTDEEPPSSTTPETSGVEMLEAPSTGDVPRPTHEA